jgi:hypothetical protein
VDADDLSVLAFRAGQSPIVSRGADAIDLTEVLPGFELTADDVFNALRI